MASSPLPDQSTLRNLLDYDAESGIVRWLPRPKEMFPATRGWQQRYADSWNTKYAWKPALTARNKKHLHGAILGRTYLTHRIIWKWVFGDEPDQIDHLNGDPEDNRLANLAASNNSLNAKNKWVLKRNTSGYCGVSWRADKRRWRAYITVSGRQIGLGHFATAEEANLVRLQANVRYGFSARHGEAP